jgi:hypothetical protein
LADRELSFHVGVHKGDGKTPGTPKLTELPLFNSILDNSVNGGKGAMVHVLNTQNTTLH